MKRETTWEKTRFSNLVRYQPSGTYFIRAKVHGKLIRESLGTNVETVAKLKLDDRLKELRVLPAIKNAAKMTFGEAGEIFKGNIQRDPDLKPRAKDYRIETLELIYRTWGGLKSIEVKRITDKDVEKWAAGVRAEYSATRFNGALETLRAVFAVAITEGALARNPAMKVSRAKVKQAPPSLPSQEQFEKMLAVIDSREPFAPGAGVLVRLLAFSGMRIDEARNLQWRDVDLEKKLITVRGDPEHGTKNSEIRIIPIIPDLAALLTRIKPKDAAGPIVALKDCRKTLTTACVEAKCERITHHDLRHLFATRCIEAGVDIPTVSRWLGHKDGGALAMKVYGHLRDQHSAAMAQRVTFGGAQ